MPKGKATQDFVPIEEIRDSVVILKNGGMRAVLIASTLNFALKSSDEQQAILSQFQNMLNSLDFPVQFHVQSRELDIRPYVAVLEGRYKEQDNELMRIQTREYINFVKTFTENANIMSKNFFVVVPYNSSLSSDPKGLLSKITGGLIGGKKENKAEGEKRKFEENKSQLEQRLSVVRQGLIRSGVRAARLGTEELIELYFKILNPGEANNPIVDKVKNES